MQQEIVVLPQSDEKVRKERGRQGKKECKEGGPGGRRRSRRRKVWRTNKG